MEALATIWSMIEEPKRIKDDQMIHSHLCRPRDQRVQVSFTPSVKDGFSLDPENRLFSGWLVHQQCFWGVFL